MNRRRIGRVVAAVVAILLLIPVSRGVALAAAPGTPFDQVLDKLDAIIGMLTPTPPEPEGEVTLSTSVIFATGQEQVFCLVTNVGTENVDVDMRVIRHDGFVLEVVPTVEVEPGKTGFNIFEEGGLVALRCEFTVHGSASSVRANLLVENSTGGATASAEAR